MSKEKFTPGPWTVTTGKHTETTDLYDAGDVWFNVNGDDGVIADIPYGRCLPADEDEARENAKIIAVTPVFYMALKRIARIKMNSGIKLDWKDAAHAIDLAKEALLEYDPEILNTLEPQD